MGDKRTVFITGGTGRIGKVLIQSMLNDGYNVLFSSTSKTNAEELIQSLVFDENTQCEYIILNFYDKDEMLSNIAKIKLPVDTIIHNARDLNTLKIADDFEEVALNFQGELNNALVVPFLINNQFFKKGFVIKDIVFISSMYGVVAPNKNLYNDIHKESVMQYGVAKAAQIHLVKELAVRLADKSVRVNAISYGGVEGRVNEDFLKKYKSMTPMGRMLESSDLYPPIQFLLKNEKLAITGENIKIDGGWTIW